MSTPEVTVVLMTYNHGPFVEQALDSILAQKTGFQFEVIVTEDCSTDGTREIVQRYAQDHPDVMRLMLSDHNICTNEVLARAYHGARGRYVALLEGDDYWTSPEKLQRQFDFMLERPECAISFHNVLEVYEEETATRKVVRYTGGDPGVTLRELAQYNPICTATVMIARQLLPRLPEWYTTTPIGDWELFLIAAQAGNIGYLDLLMAVYRKHAAGYWSGMNALRRVDQVLHFYDVMLANTEGWLHDAMLTARGRYLIPRAVEHSGLPADAIVLIASGGDQSFLYICGRYAEHFPRGADYSFRPLGAAEEEEIVGHLEEQVGAGADYLLVPESQYSWLDSLPRLRSRLLSDDRLIHADATCRIYELRGGTDARVSHRSGLQSWPRLESP